MKLIREVCLIAVFLMGSNIVALASGTPKVTNFEASGNLASANDVGCAKSSKVINKYSPADLYRGLTVCLKTENYKDGAFLFAIAGVYGRFDTFRVSDKSAHQAMTVLQMQTLGSLDKAKSEAFKAEVKKMTSDSNKLRATCDEIKRIGAPSYHPQYMIQHGMKAFTGGASNKGLIDNFDSKTAWVKAQESYLHCPKN